jgi:hypothetical protein
MYDYNNPKVGDIVYMAYSPAKVGKIITLRSAPPPVILPSVMNTGPWCVRVKFANGKTEDIEPSNLKCFLSLIADHEKKINTHKAMLAKIENIPI